MSRVLHYESGDTFIAYLLLLSYIHVNKLFIALLLIHVFKTNSSRLFFFQSFSKEILKEVGSMNRDEFTNCYTNCYICLWYEQHFSLNTITAHTERILK